MPGHSVAMHKSLYTTAAEKKAVLALLRHAREQAGLTQADMAERLGVSQGMVSKCETGGRRLDVVELWKWLRATGVAFTDFANTLDAKLSGHHEMTGATRGRKRT